MVKNAFAGDSRRSGLHGVHYYSVFEAEIIAQIGDV